MSGNIQIGFVDHQKCSSRILKPPGGGYSDIFGTDDKPQVASPKIKYNISQSKMSQILQTETVTLPKSETNEEVQNTTKTIDQTDKNGATAEETQTEEKNLTEEVEKLNISNGSASDENKENGDSKEQKHETPSSPNKERIRDIINDGPNESPAKIKNEVKEEIKSEVNPRPVKTRVPPGGYSSGLW